MKDKTHVTNEPDANRDPITKEPGSHPVGTAVGSATTGAAGMAVGAAVGGPVGALVGGVAGAVAGGLGGHAAGEAVNPTVEDAYWREAYPKSTYYKKDRPYDVYAPAYRSGWEAYDRYRGKKWDEVESKVESDWRNSAHSKNLDWQDAKQASRDAWHRVERALPGDADRDGR